MKILPSHYTEEYYNSVNYCNYNERGERYYHLAKEVEELLSKLSLINRDSSILDYGCAFGFLLDGFVKLGYEKLYGYDISEYCKDICQKKPFNFLEKPEGEFDIIFALDVFEHLTDNEINELFSKLKSKILIARIPCADYDKNDFYLDISKKDVTHINPKDKNGWKSILSSYDIFLPLNLFSIYDAKGVYSFMALRSF